MTKKLKKPYDTSQARFMLRGWCKTRKIAYRVLAELLGVDVSLVNSWVYGYARPRYLDRVKLERITGIPRDDWLTAEEHMEIKKCFVEVDRLRRARPVPNLSAKEKVAGRI